MLQTVSKWIDDRTGLISAIDYFFEEEIPASAGWHQVFGSVALFAFLLQVVTGILMALNYAPTPGEAWESLRYMVTQVTAGSIIRALHHWGASAMIIVVVLHMAQTFLWGAYKKPREATWILGVVLAAADAGVRAQRISAGVGQPGLLGHDGHDAHHRAGAGRLDFAALAGNGWKLHRPRHVRAILRRSRHASAPDHGVADSCVT